MKKMYIAGKITGEVDTEELMNDCISKFNTYGFSIIKNCFQFSRSSLGFYYYHDGNNLHYGENSFVHGLLINKDLIPNGTWKQYMKNDLKVLLDCDEIHMLPDWKDSRGATLEHNLAITLGIPIIYAT